MYANLVFSLNTTPEVSCMKKNIQQAFLINEKIGILLNIPFKMEK